MPAAIYLDHHATTPVDPRVVEAMAPYWRERFGHPASRQHAFGWDAEKAVETARSRVADLVGAESREIVFTSGGTESDNLAVKGAAETLASKGRHVVTTAVENRPVLDACAWLERRGYEVSRVAPDERGRIAPADVAAALRPDTVLVSVQMASHEVGTVQDLEAIGAVCAEADVWLHTDATQASAWCPIDVAAQGIHLLSLSGHRMFGPKGIGALYVRRRKPRVRLAPQLHGGGHEHGTRSGTVNVPGAVGLGMAAELCREEGAEDVRRVGALRDRLETGLLAGAEGIRVLGGTEDRLPNNSAISVAGVEGEALMLGVPQIALATGSACTSATLEPSYVLEAMGLPKTVADTNVRFGLGRFTTGAEIDETIRRVVDTIARIRP
ncbi:MAG: cysteine desulfurase family protein [Planctomycetota bacterium]|jgi:cysteine desulfurase